MDHMNFSYQTTEVRELDFASSIMKLVKKRIERDQSVKDTYPY